jgi:hypothetical protein
MIRLRPRSGVELMTNKKLTPHILAPLCEVLSDAA